MSGGDEIGNCDRRQPGYRVWFISADAAEQPPDKRWKLVRPNALAAEMPAKHKSG
jgi:hypothetical protein